MTARDPAREISSARRPEVVENAPTFFQKKWETVVRSVRGLFNWGEEVSLARPQRRSTP